MNLIHSFCPPSSCQSVIFARVSLDDNVHQQESGAAIKDPTGRNIVGDVSLKPKVVAALNRLAKVPHGYDHSLEVPVVVSWGFVASQIERDDMKREFNSSHHNVFRQLDPRRYSMYYNRQKSYHQAHAYEKENNMTFTWVVHARLDSVWGEPVQPVQFWETLDHTVNHRYDSFPPTADHLKHSGLHGQHEWVEAKDVMPQADKFKMWVADSWWRYVFRVSS
jgi:hypothetical protein